MAKNPGDRRSTFLINPRFQLSFFGFFAVLCGLLCTCLYLAIYFFFRKFTYAAETLNLSKDHMIFVYLSQQEFYLRMIFISTALVGLSLVFMGAFYLSHRVAGPMLRLRTSLDAMAKEGRLREIRFRQGDYFTEVAESFNELVKKIGEK
jgi:hypothetical protein